MFMKKLKKWLTRLAKSRYPYEPLITIEISRGRLIGNLVEFEKLSPNVQISPVLKSNAYGHGLVEVAQAIEESHVIATIPFFVVDSYFEAVVLRTHDIKTPLLIVGYNRPETIATSVLKNVSFVVTSMDTLKALAKNNHKIKSPIHIKIDTGMRRQGVLPEEINEAILIVKNSDISLQGVCSHMPDADNPDSTFTTKQIDIWNSIVARFKKDFPGIRYIHLSNTDGHRFSDKIHANVARLGIGLYGLIDGSLFPTRINVKPVMKMRTIITGTKELKTGDTVGYGNTFKAERPMKIATIPVGYFEGIPRQMSNKGSVLVGENNIPCRIVGRISMNIITIDVSDVRDVAIGTPVVVISDEANDANSITSIAKTCNTITYEIAVKIPAHLKRIVVG